MAWLGVVAVIGLIVCGVTALYDLRRRRKQRKLPPGEVLPPSWWTGPHIAMVVGGGVVLIAVAIGVLLLVFGSGTTTSPAKLVTVPTSTTTTTTASSSTTSTTLGPARPPELAVDPFPGRVPARPGEQPRGQKTGEDDLGNQPGVEREGRKPHGDQQPQQGPLRGALGLTPAVAVRADYSSGEPLRIVDCQRMHGRWWAAQKRMIRGLSMGAIK